MGLKLKSLFEHFFYATDLVSIRTIFGSLPQSTTRPTFSMVGSHVPYKSLAELRAAYMPDVAWAFSGLPQADPGGRVTPRFKSKAFCEENLEYGAASFDLLSRSYN